jgi:hypothetical protein
VPRRNPTALLATLAVLAGVPDLARPARAEEARPPEHGKIATADATPPGAGVVEVELSYAPTINRSGRGEFEPLDEGHVHAVSLAVGYGILDDLDVSLAVAWAFAYDAAWDHDPSDAVPPAPTRTSGPSDTAASLRGRFLSSARRALDAAWTVSAVAPSGRPAGTGAIGLTQERWSVENALVLSKDVGPLTANAELGLSLPFGARGGEDRRVLFANAAVGWQVVPSLQPELEASWHVHEGPARADPASVAITFGIVAPLGSRFRVMAGVQHTVWGRGVGQYTSGALAFKAAL